LTYAVWIAVLALLFSHAVLAWRVSSPAVLVAGDDARYYLLGQSLRQFQYTDIWEIGTPLHRDYPPAYPAVLSLWGALHGDNYDLLLLLNIALSTGALLVLFAVLKRYWSPTLGLFCILALFANPALVSTAGVLRPESLFMALSLAALGLLATLNEGRCVRVLAGAAAISAALTRPVGFALIIALLLCWLGERRYRAAAWLGSVSVATVGVWLYHSLLSPANDAAGSYRADLLLGMASEDRSPLLELASRIANHVSRYLASDVASQLALPVVSGTVIDNLVIGGTLGVFGLAGLYLMFKLWRPAAYYVLAYGGILAVWPWSSSRFLVPLLPFIVAAVMLGAHVLFSRLSARLATPAVLALALTLAGFAIPSAWDLVDRAGRCERGATIPDASCLADDSRAFFEAIGFINRELPGDAVLFSGRPATLHLYTGRMTVNRDRALDILERDELGLEWLAEEGMTHLLVGYVKNMEPRMAAAIAPHCSQLQLVGEFGPRSVLLKVGSSGPPRADSPACQALELYALRIKDPATGATIRMQREWPPPTETEDRDVP
jgi:hypothetical protein